MTIGNILNTAARWLTSGLAIWAGIHLVIIGLLVSHGAGAMGLIPIGLGFVFAWPALITLCGGRLLLIRLFWGAIAVLSLAGILYPAAHQGAVSMLIYSVLGLVFALAARDKKPEEESKTTASMARDG